MKFTSGSPSLQNHSSVPSHSSEVARMDSSDGVIPSPTISAFKLYLEAKNYQPTTVKNYIADTNVYLRSAASQNPFSPTILSAYITDLTKKNNAKRYLASLKKFCQFAADQHLCPPNLFKSSLRLSQNKPPSFSSINIDSLLSQFEAHLSHKNRSVSTIKNYLNDLNQYIEFCQKQNSNDQLSNSKSQ